MDLYVLARVRVRVRGRVRVRVIWWLGIELKLITFTNLCNSLIDLIYVLTITSRDVPIKTFCPLYHF